MEEYGFVPAIPPFGKGEFNMIKQPLQSFNSIIANLDTIRDRDDEFIRKTKKQNCIKSNLDQNMHVYLVSTQHLSFKVKLLNLI